MGSVTRIITLLWSGVNGEEYLDLSLGIYICTHLLGVNLVGFESRAGILAGLFGFWSFLGGLLALSPLNQAVKPRGCLHLEVSSSRIFVLKPAPRGQ